MTELLRFALWEDNQLKDVVKELYSKLGFEVQDKHGRLEPGCDLLAERYSTVGRLLLERVGIQVTKAAANKGRVKEACLAFLQETKRPDSYIAVALRGRTEDFDSYVESLSRDVREKIRVMGKDELEQMILRHSCTPEFEFENHFKIALSSHSLKTLRQMHDELAMTDPAAKVTTSEALAVIGASEKIRGNLTLLLRAMESLEKSSRTNLNRMQRRQNDGDYLFAFDSWIGEIKTPVTKGLKAVEELNSYSALIKLFWSSLPGTFRAYFDTKYKKRYGGGFEGLWFYNYWDGEASSDSGTFQRDRLAAIVLGVAEVASRLKDIFDRLLVFDLTRPQEVSYAQTKDIRKSSFWMKEDPKMRALLEESLRKHA